MTPSLRPARNRIMFGSVPLRKNRTDPSQNPNSAPLGCRLLNACGGVPFTWAVAWSTYHITSLIRTEPELAPGATHPSIPAQMHAVCPLRLSYLHSPMHRVLLDPSVMSVILSLLFCQNTPPKSM